MYKSSHKLEYQIHQLYNNILIIKMSQETLLKRVHKLATRMNYSQNTSRDT